MKKQSSGLATISKKVKNHSHFEGGISASEAKAERGMF